MVVCEDQKIYTWGASPHEIRVTRTKQSPKQETEYTEPWKRSVCVHSGVKGNQPIEQVNKKSYDGRTIVCGCFIFTITFWCQQFVEKYSIQFFLFSE